MNTIQARNEHACIYFSLSLAVDVHSWRSDSPAVVVDCDLDHKLRQNISSPASPSVSM